MSVNKATIAFLFVLTACFFAACKGDKASMIAQKWKTTNIENTSVKKEKEYYKKLLDTMTTQNEMVEFFGSIDSFKKVIIADLAQQEEIQKTNLENSFMEFKKNKMVYFTSVDGIDSAKWTLDDDDIVVDDEDFTGVSTVTRLSIVELDKNTLKVKMINQYDTSIISMKKAQQ